jgi:hypothetical protein
MCLSPRIANEDSLRRKTEAKVRERNAKVAPVKWQFATQRCPLEACSLVSSRFNVTGY